jgi:A nuclease of the HNH/ENDO VII superfamily with conserved WHH
VGAGSGAVARSAPELAPGKRTLTETLEPGPRVGGGQARGAPLLGSAAPPLATSSSRSAPLARVADSTEGEPNAVLRVLVYDGAGEVIQRWESRGRWEGGLPQKYTATHGGKGWSWDNTGGSTIRVNTDKDGRGGQAVEAWAKVAGKKIIVYAYAVEDVTLDEDARESDKAPGHARDPKEGGDGSTTRVNPDGKEAGGDDKSRGGGERGAGNQGGKQDGSRRGGDGNDTETEEETALGTEEDERIADVFERDLDIDPNDEALEDEPTTGATSGGQTPGGEGSPDGRTGDDTRMGGTGPGGDQARPDGDGKGSDAAGKDGTEGGSKDGQQGGAEGGMYGGEGKPGDDGIPSGSGLFGGLIGIPAALKGLVEVALIIADGNITGAGSGLFRKGLGKIASAVAARRMIASEARRAAVKETKAAINAIKADRVKGAVWNAATKAEREAATRRIYWELQRTYFDAFRKATRQAKREAQAVLDKSAGNVAAQQKLKHAELAEEATNVRPVAGRLPQNHDYAGQAFPTDLLPPKYRSKGLRFTKEGYPDFAPHAKQLPNGKNHVEIEYTGSRRADEAVANKKAKLDETPDGWMWHHAEDMKTMYLVPDDLHQAVRHSGGVAIYKHGSGVPKYGD